MNAAKTKKILFSGFLGTVLFLFGFSAAPSFRLTFFDQIVTEKSQVLLGDVARIYAEKGLEEEKQNLAATYLCDVPRAGFSRELSRGFIIMKLKQMNVNLEKFDFSGPLSVVVRRREGVLKAVDLNRALVDWLGKRLGLDKDAFEISLQGPLTDLVVPYGKAELRFQGKEDTFLKGRAGVVAEISVEKTLVKRMNINFEVLLYRDVIALNVSVEKGHPLKKEYLRRVRQKVLASRNSVFVSEEEALTSEASEALLAGQVITRDLIAPHYLVRKGDQVQGSLLEKNMRLTILLEAKEAGRLGDLIQLENPMTRARVQGNVMGEKEVMILS